MPEHWRLAEILAASLANLDALKTQTNTADHHFDDGERETLSKRRCVMEANTASAVSAGALSRQTMPPSSPA
jgi:hypothetical protein